MIRRPHQGGHDFFAIGLIRPVLGHTPSLTQRNDAICDRKELLKVSATKDNGNTLLLPGLNESQEPFLISIT